MASKLADNLSKDELKAIFRVWRVLYQHHFFHHTKFYRGRVELKFGNKLVTFWREVGPLDNKAPQAIPGLSYKMDSKVFLFSKDVYSYTYPMDRSLQVLNFDDLLAELERVYPNNESKQEE